MIETSTEIRLPSWKILFNIVWFHCEQQDRTVYQPVVRGAISFGREELYRKAISRTEELRCRAAHRPRTQDIFGRCVHGVGVEHTRALVVDNINRIFRTLAPYRMVCMSG